MKMKLTRERVILVGLLSAAGIAMYVDQYVMPASAASPADEYTVAAPAAAGPKVAHTAPLTPEAMLASRLHDLAGKPPESPEQLRNVFIIGRPADVAAPAAAAPAPVPVVNPLSKRTLNGVLFGADGKGIAIVDGRMVRLGERVDGMRLVRVTKQMATFSDGSRELTLRLSQKSGSTD